MRRMKEAISWLIPAERDPCRVTKSGRKIARYGTDLPRS